jgi:hypothetical protein
LTEMNGILFLLIVVILILVAYLIYQGLPKYLLYGKKSGIWELQQCTNDIAQVAGGADQVVSMKVISKIMPYLREVDTSEYVEEYLAKYYQYTDRELRALRDDADNDTVAPRKYKFLHTLIADIADRNNISSAEEFLKKSRLTYQEFVSPTHRKILTDAARHAKINKEDVKKISKLFDKYLIDEGTTLIKSRLLDKTEDLISDNKIFKLKAGKSAMDPKRLKEAIERDPSKVFELDYIGLIPEMYDRAIASATSDARLYGRKSADEELRRQIERDAETLRLFRDYPLTTRREREAREIAARLELAAARVYGDQYARKLLKKLYWDYTPSIVLDRYRYGLDHTPYSEIAERNRRIAAETERDRARAAQIAADRAIAESITRDDAERMARERSEREALERDKELRREMEITRAAVLNAPRPGVSAAENLDILKLHSQQEQDDEAHRIAPGIDREHAPPGIDPEIWAMGARDDNIDEPLVLLD